MGIDVQSTFAKGGKELLDFLSFCVIAYRIEPLFAFFHREYTFRPTPERALVLYDCFCSPGAPARMRAEQELLPPRNIRFAIEMEELRDRTARFSSLLAVSSGASLDTHPDPSDTPDAGATRPRAPGVLAASRHFQQLVARLSAGPASPVQAAGSSFNPELSPAANLPGGTMSPSQRAFVDNVWRPRIAPALVFAGFRHASNLV